MSRKQRQPPTAEQVARLQRELEQQWVEETEVVVEAPPRVQTETDKRVDKWLKDFLGQ